MTVRRPPRPSARTALVLALVALLVVLTILGPVLAGDAGSRPHVADLLQAPSRRHPLGTDNLGRDTLARVVAATRLSMLLALGATLVAATVGLALGCASLARRIGAPFSAALGMLIAFPSLLLALFFAVVFGAGPVGALLAVGLAMAPIFGRLVQTLGASVVEADYVQAARLLGLGRARILLRYVLPNVAAPLLGALTIAAGGSLVALSELSFLGVGVQQPSYDWGQLLQSGLPEIYTSPAAALGPAAAILFAGLTLNLVGEQLGDDSARTRRRAPRRSSVAPSPAAMDPGTVAEVRGLSIAFAGAGGSRVEVVHDVSFSIGAGERVGLVGESGSGKSLTALALAGLAPAASVVSAETLRVGSIETIGDGGGRRAGVVFQDAGRALNPLLRIGPQIAEASRRPRRRERHDDARSALHALKVAQPALRARQYPHELSGGLRQRALIAMALAGGPRLVIADEPTTALDVTVQQATLAVLRDAVAEAGSALLFISHDIAVVADVCERVLVMYDGRIVEELPVAALPDGASHPYTRALLRTLPDLEREPGTPLPTIPDPPTDAAGDASGCAFAPRCPHAGPHCAAERPALAAADDGHRVACWHPQHGAAAMGSVEEETVR